MFRTPTFLPATILTAITLTMSTGSMEVAAQVTFGPPPPLGTTWTAPISPALTQNNIDMSLQTFNWLPSGTGFNHADIVAPPDQFAVNPTQELAPNEATQRREWGACLVV